MGCGASAEAQRFQDTIGGPLENSSGQTVDAGTLLEGKYKMILFSVDAPDHIEFTLYHIAPLLQQLKGRNVQVEVVLISDDPSEEAYKAHLAKCPMFYAVPWTDQARRQQLHYVLGVPGPGLVVCDTDGEVITIEGHQAVQGDPQGQDFPWKPSKSEGLMDALAGGE